MLRGLLFRYKFNKRCNEWLVPNTKTKWVLQIFKQQGYWSGVRYNIFYNKKTKYFYAMPRTNVSSMGTAL